MTAVLKPISTTDPLADVARCVGVNERICDTCARLAMDSSARVWLWPDPVPKDGRCEHHIQMQTRDGAQA